MVSTRPATANSPRELLSEYQARLDSLLDDADVIGDEQAHPVLAESISTGTS